MEGIHELRERESLPRLFNDPRPSEKWFGPTIPLPRPRLIRHRPLKMLLLIGYMHPRACPTVVLRRWSDLEHLWRTRRKCFTVGDVHEGPTAPDRGLESSRNMAQPFVWAVVMQVQGHFYKTALTKSSRVRRVLDWFDLLNNFTGNVKAAFS